MRFAAALMMALVSIPCHANFDYNTAKKAVVTIYCEPSRSGGGGVLVSRLAIVTMRHVVDKCTNQVIVGFYDGTSAVGSVISVDENNDLVIVRPDRLPDMITVAPIEVSVPEMGESLHLIAHPNGLTWSYSPALLAFPHERKIEIEKEEVNVLEVNTVGFYGSSGGALFNSSGRVVGFAKGNLATTNLSFFIPSGAVCKRLLKCKVER